MSGRMYIIFFMVLLLVFASFFAGCGDPGAEENGAPEETQEAEADNDRADDDLPDPYKERVPPDEIAVRIDGQLLEADVPPKIIDGRTLVPMRLLFEALGAEVEWDGEARTVEAVRGDESVSLTIDEVEAFVNGQRVQLDVPPQIVDGRTLIPVRFASEALGADVEWDVRVIDVTTGD